MFKKTSTLFLAAILVFANTHVLLGQTDGVAGDRRIKTQVNKLGTGAKVTVTLRDGTKVRGSISQIQEDSFDVTLAKQTQSSVISYRDVENVKRRGWSTTEKMGLGVGIGVGAVVVVIVLALAALKGGSGAGPVF